MAKLAISFIGSKLRGTLGDVITFTSPHGQQIAKRKPIPTDPRSPAQLVQRQKVRSCVTEWDALDPDEKQAYINQAKGYPQTAFGLFLTACLLAPPVTATLKGNIIPETPAWYIIVARFFTPNTQTEVFRAAANTDAAGDFTMPGIPPGTYDVGVKGQRTLSILAEDKVFIAGQDTNIAFGSPRGGDLDEDDYVAESDYAILSGFWHQWGNCYNYPGDWLLP